MKHWHLQEGNSIRYNRNFKIYFKNLERFERNTNEMSGFNIRCSCKPSWSYYILYSNSDTNNSRCKIFWYRLCYFWGTLLEYRKTQVQAGVPHSCQMLQNLSAVLSIDWHIISLLEREGGDFQKASPSSQTLAVSLDWWGISCYHRYIYLRTDVRIFGYWKR